MQFDTQSGLWTFEAGSLAPLYDSLPKDYEYNAPSLKQTDLFYQMLQFEPQATVAVKPAVNAGAQLSEGAVDNGSEDNQVSE